MRAHEENAFHLAKFFSRHRKVECVHYPGLKASPAYAVTQKQMTGFGRMISLELNGDYRAAQMFLSQLKIFSLAESLGGEESLVSYPAGMTHASMPREERLKRAIKDNLVRLSMGIENKADLKRDLAGAP